MKKIKIILSVVIFIVLMLIAFPYAKVELSTSKYIAEFGNENIFAGITTEIDYMKVYSYSEGEAEVYIVTNNKHAGIMCTFNMENDNQWKLESWEAVWSKSGSASNFIWPYYR